MTIALPLMDATFVVAAQSLLDATLVAQTKMGDRSHSGCCLHSCLGKVIPFVCVALRLVAATFVVASLVTCGLVVANLTPWPTFVASDAKVSKPLANVFSRMTKMTMGQSK